MEPVNHGHSLTQASEQSRRDIATATPTIRLLRGSIQFQKVIIWTEHEREYEQQRH